GHAAFAGHADLQWLRLSSGRQILDQRCARHRAGPYRLLPQPHVGPAARHVQPEAEAMNRPLLEVRNLQTHFLTSMGAIRAVDDVSFSLQRGEVLGLVGESGSGKTITGYSILGVVDEPGRIVGGEIVLRDTEDGEVVLNHLGEKQLRRLRGNRIAMIMQDPMMSLNPSLRIGTQLVETVLAHRQVSRSEAERRAVDVM